MHHSATLSFYIIKLVLDNLIAPRILETRKKNEAHLRNRKDLEKPWDLISLPSTAFIAPAWKLGRDLCPQDCWQDFLVAL